MKCLNNCSCMAYTNSYIRGQGSGCVMWFGDLIDIKQFENDGQDLYIRMDSSELGIHKDLMYLNQLLQNFIIQVHTYTDIVCIFININNK